MNALQTNVAETLFVSIARSVLPESHTAANCCQIECECVVDACLQVLPSVFVWNVRNVDTSVDAAALSFAAAIVRLIVFVVGESGAALAAPASIALLLIASHTVRCRTIHYQCDLFCAVTGNKLTLYSLIACRARGCDEFGQL